MTSRRGFLGVLATLAAGATLDPERALWVPGKKLISIPAPAVVAPTMSILTAAHIEVGDILTFGLFPQRYVVTKVQTQTADLWGFEVKPLDLRIPKRFTSPNSRTRRLLDRRFGLEAEPVRRAERT